MAKKPMEYIVVENFNPDPQAIQKVLGWFVQQAILEIAREKEQEKAGELK